MSRRIINQLCPVAESVHLLKWLPVHCRYGIMRVLCLQVRNSESAVVVGR